MTDPQIAALVIAVLSTLSALGFEFLHRALLARARELMDHRADLVTQTYEAEADMASTDERLAWLENFSAATKDAQR